jgi:hypothetical protein
MSLELGSIGVLSNLAIALGVFTPEGEPNPNWFGDPEASLSKILEDNDQRNALIAFVDEVMGGADRTTDPTGVIWLPMVQLEDPQPDITFAITIDDTPADGVHIGVGISVRTTNPTSNTSLSIPLFLAKKEGGPSVPSVLLLGARGGRIRIGTLVTVDEGDPVPGVARLGAIGLDVDVPTSGDDEPPVFGLGLTGFQLPGATTPRDIRVAADGLDELDDAVLDLVLSLLKAQAESAAEDPSFDATIINAITGLLGLKDGDAIPDFPIQQLPEQGVQAISTWMYNLITTTASRQVWIDYLADLLDGNRVGDTVTFDLGDADLTLRLRVDTGPTGNARLTPTLDVQLGNADTRVEAHADLFQIDLVTGAATALPQFGVWAVAGGPANRILNITEAQADALRVGFALNEQRSLTLVLAADVVRIGTHDYPTLDLTSPDAVMDVVGNTIEDIASELLGSLGDVLGTARLLIGLDAPAGVTTISLTDLMTDPVAAVSGYWQRLIPAPPGAMTEVLRNLRNAMADQSAAVAPTSLIGGTGTALDPWIIPLIRPLQLEVIAMGTTGLSVSAALVTSIDTLGQRCTVVQTHLAATLAELDFSARSANLLPRVEALLSARERGVTPPRAMLAFGDGAALSASGVGLSLGWTPSGGLSADVQAPNLTLTLGTISLPIRLPEIEADGSVNMSVDEWDAVEVLVGYLGELTGGFLADIVDTLGWAPETPVAGVSSELEARLRLADLVNDPQTALRAWVPRVLKSEAGPRALAILADLFAGVGPNRGFIRGTGHPDDPYRFDIAENLPNIAVWFPPAGLEPQLVGAPSAIQRWRPGDPGLSAQALAACLRAEANAASDVRSLIDGRDLAGGLAALASRWVGGDGRIVPPGDPPAGITIYRSARAVRQLLEIVDLQNFTGHTPTTTVYVALGANPWPQALANRRVDLTAPGLGANMFALPNPSTGEWFVALGNRLDCRVATSVTDGTPEQAERLGRILDALAEVSSDVTVVALAGAGHAARLAAQAQTKVTHLITLGTPLSPIALTAINTQPTADALRLLYRLLPPAVDPTNPDLEREDEDLALGRGLITAMMELVDRLDPSADLRIPTLAMEPPRAGLAITAIFGVVTESQVSRAMTAIVAAGLAERARNRAGTPLPEPTGFLVGLRFALPETTSGTLAVSGDALLTLVSYEEEIGLDTTQQLRARLRIRDRLSWLSSTPDLELRMVTADLSLPLDGAAHGEATITLHDGRVFGQTWERLTLGTAAGNVPVLPEARVLLSTAIQRISSDVAGTASVALSQLLTALGLMGTGGGVIGDAVDQFIHDPGGLVRTRVPAFQSEIAAALTGLLGSLSESVNLDTRSVHIEGGSDSTGRFGWLADVSLSPEGLAGQLRFGAEVPSQPAGGLNAIVDLEPFHVTLQWHQPGNSTDTAALWPDPEAAQLTRMLVKAAPSLGGHAALELMRRADETAKPVIDAVLDALGLLNGVASDVERSIRPLAGLLADPAGWLRSSASLASSATKIQALFDALRPLLGVAGVAGEPVRFATGVSLSVVADGPGARLALDVDPSSWTPNGTARFASGLAAALGISPSGPPNLGLAAHVGLTGAPAGRQAVHVLLSTTGAQLFVRPLSGNDISLIPFAGLGSLSAAAEAALPFLLDKLAEVPGTVGDLVQTLGDGLMLRTGTPRTFDADALHTWSVNPAGALKLAGPSIVTTGLSTFATRLGDFIPDAITVTSTADSLIASIDPVSVSWNPSSGEVTLIGTRVTVPGVDEISFKIRLSENGINEVSTMVGPSAIEAGSVILRPFITVAGGLAPVGERRVAVGMAADETKRFAARWLLDSKEFALLASDGELSEAVESDDPGQVSLRIVEIVAGLLAAVALAQQTVQDLLGTSVTPTQNVRGLLAGVILDEDDPTQLISDPFDPDTILARIATLFNNIATAAPFVEVDDLRITFTKDEQETIGLLVGLEQRYELLNSDVMLWLENEDAWITDNPGGPGGVFVGFIPKPESGPPLDFKPSLGIYGVGLRIGKTSGPLLDIGVTLESIALHTYALITGDGIEGGGLQLQFSNLAVSASSAGGDNGIAKGIMRDTGPTPPKPMFSPALAIQKHGNDPISVTLRAGDGDGPWWIAIQKGFGPLYLEQIGFGATMPDGHLERISLLMDGSVSMFGLTCAVDDLQITYFVMRDGQPTDIFSAESWSVDLAGLAVSANMAGVSIAGGLLKQTTDVGIEYLGMLLGRFGVYGITIYGGYGEGKVGDDKFVAFFAVGAINGPIGGPPAFFLTGIGGGFGINRLLIVPTDLSRFGEYPLIQALDIAAQPQDPMQQLRELGQYFTMSKGTFWFAAGISFNSFALVDGIAVIAVQIGDGLDINLLGLARMALPRPQVALVSIEIALLVRFSSSEGVLWVQGQLTDNSWLLYPEIKLTGGFAYVIWFKGEHGGEFVLTLGGYHPDFHRDGYPVVARLGLRWSIGDSIVIKAGSYFALTSEALMAGGDFEASADFGPAWARVNFGAHGIIYFDPFSYYVYAYARIAAGVTIDTWLFGEITFSINIGARIEVKGPDFTGRATFEVGPIELTVAFGGPDKSLKDPLSATDFIAKYLEAGDSGALAHAVITSFGALPSKGEQATPDGSAARPFIVVTEFGLTFTSTVPATAVTRVLAATNPTTTHSPSTSLGVAPMGESNLQPTIKLTWKHEGTALEFPFVASPRKYGSFPAGVWGLPQDMDNRKIPKAEMLEALNELDLVTRADPTPGGPEIPYYQVEIGQRKALPFARRAAEVQDVRDQAADTEALITKPTSVAEAFSQARTYLSASASPTALASLRGERQSPPLLGSLTEGLQRDRVTVKPGIGDQPPARVYDHFVDPPVTVGMLAGSSVDLRVGTATRTTVEASASVWRTAPPTLASVESERSRSIAARLVLVEPGAVSPRQLGTVIANVAVPPSAIAHAAPVTVARRGAPNNDVLNSFTSGLVTVNTPSPRGRAKSKLRADASHGATLLPGQIVVLKLPNARADAAIGGDRPQFANSGAPARVILFGHGGNILADQILGANTPSLEVVQGTERILAISLGEQTGSVSDAGLLGWHAGAQMPYVGWSTGIGPGCVVHSSGEQLRLHDERLEAGWVSGAELARGVSTVTTTFSDAPKTVVIILDDPAAFGNIMSGRQLLLGLDGADRAQDAAGAERAPVLLVTENRSVLAYDILPDGIKPVVVTIASEEGWSVVGVMGSASLNATGAISAISSRGLDAALRPLATSSRKQEVSRLAWLGSTRTTEQRLRAKALAMGRPPVTAKKTKKAKKTKPRKRGLS